MSGHQVFHFKIFLPEGSCIRSPGLEESLGPCPWAGGLADSVSWMLSHACLVGAWAVLGLHTAVRPGLHAPHEGPRSGLLPWHWDLIPGCLTTFPALHFPTANRSASIPKTWQNPPSSQTPFHPEHPSNSISLPMVDTFISLILSFKFLYELGVARPGT